MVDAEATAPMTLREFIRESKDLISVIGVFTALTVFSANIGRGIFSVWLSAAFLFVTMLLWWELFTCFPAECTERLKTFRFVLFFGVVALFFYWLGLIAWISKGALAVLIYVTLLSLLVVTIEPAMSLMRPLRKPLALAGIVLVVMLYLTLPWFAAKWVTPFVASLGSSVRAGFTGARADSSSDSHK